VEPGGLVAAVDAEVEGRLGVALRADAPTASEILEIASVETAPLGAPRTGS
jgi:hypothetical protein